MPLLKDIQDYSDSYGLFHPYLHPSPQATNNGVRYTSEAAMMAKANGEAIWESYQETVYKTFLDCEQHQDYPGLISRSPISTIDNQIDDYTAILAYTAYCGDYCLAKSILEHGKKMFWLYNDQTPTKFQFKSWFIRFPQLIAQMHFAVGEAPNWFLRLYTIGTILKASLANKQDQDAWALTHHLIVTLQYSEVELNFLEKLAIEKWKDKFYTYYPKGMGQLLGEYFGNSEVPIAKYWKEILK